jgi:hypothetical protein
MTAATGIVTGLYVCSDPASFVSVRRPEVTVVANGFAGDKHATWERAADSRARHYARGTAIWNSRQLSIVSEEDLAAIAAALELPTAIAPEWLGANICVRGIPSLTQLPPGTRLLVDTAGFYITALNKPCIAPGKEVARHFPDAPADVAARFVKVAHNLRGVVAVVERPGTIHEGATITVRAPSEI